MSRILSQDRQNTVSYILEITIIAGAFLNMDHIDLPKFSLPILAPCMPFDASLDSMQKIDTLYLLTDVFAASSAIARKLSDKLISEV